MPRQLRSCLAVLLLLLAGCASSGTAARAIAPRPHSAAEVVAAFRAHGLAAVDPTPYAPAQPPWWYAGRPGGTYTVETVVVGARTSPGLYAGVVWVAPDDATASAIANYARDLRDLGILAATNQFQSYRQGNIVLLFNYDGETGWGVAIQRYFVALGDLR
jgi:hypothetical protein